MSTKSMLAIELTPDRIRLRADGRHVASYIYRGCWRPYFWPLCAAAGNVVRGVNAREHPNQYGLALAYGGHATEQTTSIWSDYDEPPYGPCGKMVHGGFEAVELLDERTALIAERTVWVSGRGEVMGGDVRQYEVQFLSGGELLIRARQRVRRPSDPVPGQLVCSVRVADSLRVKAVYNAEGHVPGEIRNSDGAVGEEATKDRPARWCSYAGRLGDDHGGIALFSHPQNPQHPAPFFTREYGVFTQRQEFGPDDGELLVRWSACVYNGPCDPARLDAIYEAYAAWS